MKKITHWTIYALVDPRTDEVRYVGKAHDVTIRLEKHISLAKYGKMDHKSNWLRSLMDVGMSPSILTLETGFGLDWGPVEIKWIAHYRGNGAPLTNVSGGGEGGIHSEETKRKIAIANTGRIFSPEHLVNMSRSRKGKKWKPGFNREKWLAARIGVKRPPPSPQALINMSLAQRGKKLSPETRSKISAAGFGRKQSKETKDKSSKSRRDWWARHGGVLPEETRKKLSVAARKYWENKRSQI